MAPGGPGHRVAFTEMGLRKRFLVAVVGVPGSPAEAQRSEVGRFRNLGAAEEAGRDEWKRILFVHAPHVERYRIVVEDDGVEVADVPMPELPADSAPGILDETVTPLGASVGALGEPIDPDAAHSADTPDGTDTTEEAADADAPGAPEVMAAEEAADAAAAEPESPPEEIQATGELAVVEDGPDDLAATGEHKGMADEVASDDVATTGEVPVIAPVDDDAPGGGGDGDGPPPAPRPPLEIEDPPDGPVPDEIIQRFAQMVEAEEQRAAERSARDRNDGD
jgi:hypothetical protein